MKLAGVITAFIILFFNIFYGSNSICAIEFENTQLFELSFQELMSTKVRTGSLLSLNNFNKPASVTTITSQDIKRTPHRNLYDLIETYVPGAIFFNHYDASSIGVRGLVSDRNNKILIMINNKVSNQKARVGALAELSNWDMSDIDRIEVIRGSGSVTYGPGAISAVINVITKDVHSEQSNNINVNYNHPYNSKGISGQFNQEISEDISVFAYFSIQKTDGYQPSQAYSIMYNDWKYENAKKDIFQDYMRDYLDIPQKKFHLQFDLFNEINLWVRYNNSGSTSNGASIKTTYQLGLDSNFQQILGDYRNTQLVSNEQFIVALENEYNINEKLSLSSSISYDIENNSRSIGYFTLWGKDDAPPESLIGEILDQGNIRNMYNYFSEREILGTFVLRSETSDNIRFAAGTSLSYNTWGAPFGEPDNYIRMGDRSNIISGTDSPIYGDGRYFGIDSNEVDPSKKAIFVGNGWSTFMYSFFGEIEFQILPEFSLLLSSRLDKDDYSDYLISPRFALTYQFDDNNIIKLIGQQSNRMNTAEELFFQNRAGNVSSPEKLNTSELIYTTTIVENTLFEIASYYSNIDILSWNDADRTTKITGNLSLLGFEIDLKYKNDIFSVGLNQSITQLLDWKLADGIEKSGVRENGQLKAVPYSQYYKESEQLSKLLEEAAGFAENPSFKNYLIERAKSIRTNDYYPSDLAWMDIENSDVDLVIGPIENYQDELFNYKSAYEAVVMVKDEAASKELEVYRDNMQNFENSLPIEDKYKQKKLNEGNKIQVVNVVYFGGDCQQAVKTIAAALPNDPKVAEKKGRKLSMYKNFMEAKFDVIVNPIGQILLSDKDAKNVDKKAFTSFVTLHEVSHALGPKYVFGTKKEIRDALKDKYSAIEECKADILSMYNHQYLLNSGYYNQEYIDKAKATYLAGLYRSIRFGTGAHAASNYIQLNFLKEKKAIYKDANGKLAIDNKIFFDAVKELATLILAIQAEGNYQKAVDMVNKYGQITNEIEVEVDLLKNIPRDINTSYDF